MKFKPSIYNRTVLGGGELYKIEGFEHPVNCSGVFNIGVNRYEFKGSRSTIDKRLKAGARTVAELFKNPSPLSVRRVKSSVISKSVKREQKAKEMEEVVKSLDQRKIKDLK